MQHIEKPGLAPDKLQYWKKERVKKCLRNLTDYIEEITRELDKEKIENHCSNLKFGMAPFEPDVLFLIHNSYYGSVVTDILWARDISIKEAMSISGGKQDLNKLADKLPKSLNEVRIKLLLSIRMSKKYRRHASTIEEALKCFKRRYFKAFNLLIMTSIEGLVRDLAKFLSKKQGLDIDVDDSKYNSLDALLRLPDWKKDFSISRNKMSLIIGEDKTRKANSESEEFDPLEKVTVTVKERLDFLRRRFKEDRDLILHGVNHDYGKGLNLFMNVSALLHVYDVIRYYDKQYSGKIDHKLWYAKQMHTRAQPGK